MTDSEVYKILTRGLSSEKLPNPSKYRLFVVLGLLGDFDSLEYTQLLAKQIQYFKENDINLVIYGIGNQESKKIFSKYTSIPESHIEVLDSNCLHNQLGISKGLNLPIGSYLNLLLMCIGLESPGTLREVMRGYIGDKNASPIFRKNQKISFGKLINFKGSLFEKAGQGNFQRPFELASLRLMNMIEVIHNWNNYMKNIDYLTQRNATFLFDRNSSLLYSYYSKGLLNYSETMSKPLDFLKILSTSNQKS